MMQVQVKALIVLQNTTIREKQCKKQSQTSKKTWRGTTYPLASASSCFSTALNSASSSCSQLVLFSTTGVIYSAWHRLKSKVPKKSTSAAGSTGTIGPRWHTNRLWTLATCLLDCLSRQQRSFRNCSWRSTRSWTTASHGSWSQMYWLECN